MIIAIISFLSTLRIKCNCYINCNSLKIGNFLKIENLLHLSIDNID